MEVYVGFVKKDDFIGPNTFFVCERKYLYSK